MAPEDLLVKVSCAVAELALAEMNTRLNACQVLLGHRSALNL